MSSIPPTLESVFSAAIEKASREAMLAHAAEACGNHSDLLAQTQRLIEAHCRSAASFLESPATGLSSDQDQFARTVDVKPEALEAGLSVVVSENPPAAVGIAFSVLKSIHENFGANPSITLKEDPNERSQVQKPGSKEIPNTAGDSRYQIHGEIAQGGMGAILKARDVDLGRDLAIKVLLDRHRDNPEHIERFVEEAQIGGQLQHPGIAPIYELGQFEDERPFFTMKLIKGETLAAILAKRKSPKDDVPKLVGIFEQICQTMAYAHSKGVIHRDLKPANIMVGAFGEVQVMDWGLSKVIQSGGVADEKKSMTRDVSIVETRRSTGSDGTGIGSDTMDGSVMGTPAYMPPEQAHGETDRLDTRSDVFGLGAILAQVLTGSPAYIADSNQEALRQARRAELDECYERVDASSASAQLKSICKQALSAEQVDRYHDASELTSEITAYLEGVQEKLKATELARVAAETRSEEESKRKRLYLGIAGLICAAFIGSVVVALTLKHINKNLKIAELTASQEKEKALDSERKTNQALQISEEERARTVVQRITSDAVFLLEKDRVKSILLIAEAIEFARKEGVWPIPMAHAALLDATIDLGGSPLPDRQKQLMSQVGNRMVVWEPGRTQFQILDVEDEDSLETVVGTIKTEQSIENVTINADATRIVARTREKILLWETNRDGSKVAEQREINLAVHGFGLSQDGSTLAAVSEEGVYLWKDLWESGGVETRLRIGAGSKRKAIIEDPLTISADERWLVCHESGNLRLWDLEEDSPQASEKSLKLPWTNYPSTAISRDSRWLVAVAGGKTARIYDLKSEDVMSTEQPLSGIGWAVAFSPDGRKLAIRMGVGIELFDLEPTGPSLSMILQSPDDKSVGDIEFSPDSQWLAVGENRDVRLWKVGAAELSGKPRLTMPDGESAPLWIANKLDGKNRLIVGALDDWSRSIQFSSSGKWLVTSGLRTSRILDVSADRPSETILQVPENPASVKFSPDSKWFAVGCHSGKVRLYEMELGIPNREFILLDCDHDSPVQVEFSPDSQMLITSAVYALPSSTHRQIEIWRLDDLNDPIHRLSGFQESAHFPQMGPNNRFVLAPHFQGDIDFHYWDLSMDQDQEPFALSQHEAGMMFVKIDPFDGYLLSGSQDGRLLRWKTGQGKPVSEVLLRLKERVLNLQRLVDRWVVISGNQTQRTITEIAVESREISSTTVDTNDGSGSTRLSPDGKTFRVGDNVWSNSGELLIAHTHLGSKAHIFSNDGTYFASYGYTHGDYVSISNLRDHYTLRVKKQIDRPLNNQGIDFSSDNQWLAVAGRDFAKQVRIWDLDIDSLLDRARRLAGRELRDDERKDYGLPIGR
ncbi:MAG: protein kinase [Pirellulaceae bacterium]